MRRTLIGLLLGVGLLVGSVGSAFAQETAFEGNVVSISGNEIVFETDLGVGQVYVTIDVMDLFNKPGSDLRNEIGIGQHLVIDVSMRDGKWVARNIVLQDDGDDEFREPEDEESD
jgi:hypothetical protein